LRSRSASCGVSKMMVRMAVHRSSRPTRRSRGISRTSSATCVRCRPTPSSSVLVLAVIVGIGTNLFNQFTQGFGGNQPTVNDVLAMALAALTLLPCSPTRTLFKNCG
jgi:hypothetical protein